MFRPRIIPVLLLQNKGLVKSKKFKDYKYIGDPINAVRIFNDLKADELVFLDIQASQENRLISLDFVTKVGEEANMPFAVGGGIKTLDDIQKIISAGAEKVIINSYAAENPDFIRQAADTFGSSTITVCMDVKKKFLGGLQTYTRNGKKGMGYKPIEFAKLAEQQGAGEIIVQSIEKDGMRTGYDLDLIRSIAEEVTIPVVALGGAGDLTDMKAAYTDAYATGLAAGSFFVFHGKRNGVLITYPDQAELKF
ncbi:MAG: AglZ/HisF2 family acetamidino modification protein [Flammeovirgaceae bacterium]